MLGIALKAGPCSMPLSIKVSDFFDENNYN